MDDIEELSQLGLVPAVLLTKTTNLLFPVTALEHGLKNQFHGAFEPCPVALGTYLLIP
jgi:hypothetical protein